VTHMSDPLPNVLPSGSPLARQVAVVSCWMCGIRLHQNQMVSDGTSACPDIRWYCQDARACTERWTSGRRQGRPVAVVPSGRPGEAQASPGSQGSQGGQAGMGEHPKQGKP
jgi:hypothetical protein